MDWVFLFNDVVSAILEGLVLLLFFLVITDQRNFIKTKKLHCFVAVGLFTAISYWVRWVGDFMPGGLNTLAHLVFTFLLLSAITHTNLYSSAIATLIAFMFIGVIEIGVFSVGMFVLQVDISMIISTPKYKFIGATFARAVQLITAIYMVSKTRASMNLRILSNKKYVTTVFPLYQALLLVLFAMSYISLPAEKVYSPVNNALFFAIIVLLIVMNGIEWRERESTMKIKSKFEMQQQYIDNLENVVAIVRKEKHDFLNHLNTISGLCKLNREESISKVDQYVNKITQTYEPTYTFYSSGSDYIDGLLTVKSSHAHKYGILLDVDFDVPLSNAEIDEGDLVSIVSNIIDNAFEAIMRSEDHQNKVVSLLSYTEEDAFYLSISNNGPQIPQKDISKVFDYRFSTKSSRTTERGYGLYIVKELVQKNGGVVTVTSNQESTEFLIRLKCKSVEAEKTA